jgi:hypothetical protein
MLIPSGSSSSRSDGLCFFSSPKSFLRSLSCFSKGSIPQFLDEEALAAFNASMHSEYGYGKKSLDKPFTETDFKHLVEFHNYLDDRCKWMTEKWIDLLEPLQTGRYRKMYTTYNYSYIEKKLKSSGNLINDAIDPHLQGNIKLNMYSEEDMYLRK